MTPRQVAVMQPTFLPWSGYFNLMAQVADFVFLDDAQFERQSWQSRNRILLQGRAHLVTAATLRAPLQTPISAIRLAPPRQWLEGLVRGITQGYAPSAGRDDMITMIADGYWSSEGLLCEMNIRFVSAVAERLGLRPGLHRASAMGIEGHRSRRLEAICAHLGARRYLSPVGAADYLREDRFGAEAGIELTFQSFDLQPYPQRRAPAFVSHLSIVDVVCHLGWEGAARYVRTGRFE